MNTDALKTLLNQAFNTRQLGDTRILIAQAINMLDEVDSAPETPVTTVTTPPEGKEAAVVYGKGGYSDSSDPRQQNARTHADKGGLITAVWTTVHVLPETKYRCTNVTLIDENQAKGGHSIYITVRNKAGQVTSDRVLMATGYQGGIDHFDDLLESGNGKIPVEHIMADDHKGKGCTFFPPDLGPLAIYVAGPGGDKIDSDVVGDLGLPGAHHIGFLLEYDER